ncbi:BC1872 family protein [Paenibacillus alvei]|uniref:Phage ABA sandwich domain-containing protein n=1 Tax=Paenibacillus alvei TaxID=44250 RepID=A0A383REE9_PAEAL|nr:hypothetical protein [Paenibacillus alvei]SYX84636.1 conserved protein of unknown function [Paenibacillus alvei]
MTYTREQILSMPVGRGLDAIAANISGYVSLTTQLNHDGTFGTLPRYSEDISAAWELVKDLSRKYGVEVYEDGGASSECKLYQRGQTNIHVISATTPEAITKAAILAMMESGGTGE